MFVSSGEVMCMLLETCSRSGHSAAHLKARGSLCAPIERRENLNHRRQKNFPKLEQMAFKANRSRN